MLDDDDIERRWVVAETEARLFGGERRPVRVGRFEIRRRLGRGGLGVVYAAFDPELDREVALKLVRPDRSAGDDRERLLREARAMARLAHPNVVPVYEVGYDDDRVFLAMERVPGRTLREWLQTPRTWREIVRMFLQAGRGLAAAHDAKLVHRDIKPDNVLVGDDGRARVTDFGLAHDDDAVGGTPAYMAPEQRAGGAVTAAVDQYAFAISLREALGDSAPRRLAAVVQRALADDPAQRWPSVATMLDALDKASQRRVLRAIGWSLLVAVLITALIGALLQMWMFRSWMQGR